MPEAPTYDLRGLKCPLPVLKTRRRMADLKPGDELIVETSDPLAGIDIPHFCNEDGHQLLAHALGGQVDYNPAGRESGTIELSLDPAAHQDPLFSGLPSRFPAHATHLQTVLRAPEGATIEEIVAATGWLSHTVRGSMSGALKKKLGLNVESEKADDRGRVYRIAE